MFSTLFSVAFSDVWVSVSKAAGGFAEIEISPRGTYLHADPGQGSVANVPVDAPGVVDLQSGGFSEGDTILISFEGSVDEYGGTAYETINMLIGVFSSTSQLLPISDADRVPGAVNAGDDFNTAQTWFTEENTDIPEDFEITPSTGFSIKVPQNAKYLVVSLYDSWYPDNTSPGPITVTIEKQASEPTGGLPLEYILAALGLVAVIAVLVVFVVFKRRKSKTQSAHGGGGVPTAPESSHGGGGDPT